ncbi:MAG: hypothetical protein FWG44_03385 [Oscillospiraceae bacterium]|nr:hypothetical protein [Oscillospiraceae bacterium]
MAREVHLKTRVPRKNLLLPELIIVLFFFSLAAAACVKLFGLAYEDVNHSKALTAAVIEAKNAAECFKAANGDPEKTRELIFSLEKNISNISIILPDGTGVMVNSNFSAEADILPFNMRIEITETDIIKQAHIVTYKNVSSEENETLYELTVAVAKEAGRHD